MEHRWGHRHEVSKAVHLETRGGVIARGRLCNVSTSGAFVVTHLPVAVFAYLKVQFIAVVDGKRTKAAVEGQVVRKDPDGVGIEWSEFAPEEIRALMMDPPFRSPAPPGALDIDSAGIPPLHVRTRRN